jgi:hypothetical protein
MVPGPERKAGRSEKEEKKMEEKKIGREHTTLFSIFLTPIVLSAKNRSESNPEPTKSPLGRKNAGLCL